MQVRRYQAVADLEAQARHQLEAARADMQRQRQLAEEDVRVGVQACVSHHLLHTVQDTGHMDHMARLRRCRDMSIYPEEP